MLRKIASCVACLIFVATSCSSDGSGDAAPAAGVNSTTTEPESLAFNEPTAPQDLRISVPRLSFVAPSEVDVADSVQVLVTDLLTDGLTSRDSKSGFANPALAESWTVSDDLLTWTFELGENTFGSGDPITATDVVESLNAIARRGIDSLSGPNLAVVAGYDEVASGEADAMRGVVATNESTVTISLTTPYMALAELLSGVSFGVYPVGPDTNDGFIPITSSQRFEPVELTADTLRLVPKAGNDRFSAIELRVDPTGMLVMEGAVDLAVGLESGGELASMRTAISQRSADVFFGMNHNVAPFNDVDIRRAIVQAVDRVALRDEFFPSAGIMESFIPEDVVGGSPNACGEWCERDVEDARAAVEASGVGDVAFAVDFFVEDNDGDFEQRLAEAIVSDLRDVGLNATAVQHSSTEYGSLIAAGELGLFRFGSVTTALNADADIAAKFATSGRDNVTATSIAEFDRKIARARQTERGTARASTYAEAEAILFENAVVLPLIEFRHTLLLGDTIEAAELGPAGGLLLRSVAFVRP